MSNVTRISLILLTIFSCTHNYCLYFQNSSSNFCTSHIPSQDIEGSFRECLRCTLNFLPINLINQTDNCTHMFECIDLTFYNDTLFEQFFQKYTYVISNLFELSNHLRHKKTLYIGIEHDDYQELNLTYLQSVLRPNGIDYSYLMLYLLGYRKQIHLDLQQKFLNLSVVTLGITIVCNETTKYRYYVSSGTNYISQSHVCFDGEYKLPTTTRTPEKPPKSKLNLIIFLTGLIVLLIWILCICACLYARYCKWKANNIGYQRSSIVSSVFSLDSTVSDRTESITPKKQVKQIGRYGLYAFNNEL